MTPVAAGPVRTEDPSYAKFRAAPPGHWLRRGVHTALAELTEPEVDQATAHLLDLVLRDALAWTAATGDTCRFGTAAAAVRQARTALRSREVPAARDALNAANYALG